MICLFLWVLYNIPIPHRHPLQLPPTTNLNCLIFVKGCRTRRRPNNALFFTCRTKSAIYEQMCVLSQIHKYVHSYRHIYRKHTATAYVQKLRINGQRRKYENLLHIFLSKSRQTFWFDVKSISKSKRERVCVKKHVYIIIIKNIVQKKQ